MSVFSDDHALPDTSMRLSDFVLYTFLVNIFSLAVAIFSLFKMANGSFKMAAKFIMVSRAKSDKKKARADICMKLGKHVNEHK